MLTQARRTTIVVLMTVNVVVIAAAYVSEAQDGFEPSALGLGIGLLVLLAWTGRLAVGVWRARRPDALAALVTFGGIAVGGAWAAIDVVRRIQTDLVPFGAPRIHLMVPAVITVCAGAIVVLLGGAIRGEAPASGDG